MIFKNKTYLHKSAHDSSGAQDVSPQASLALVTKPLPAEARPWLSAVFGFLFRQNSDLTFERWCEIEQKRGATKVIPAPYRDRYDHMRWHI